MWSIVEKRRRRGRLEKRVYDEPLQLCVDTDVDCDSTWRREKARLKTLLRLLH